MRHRPEYNPKIIGNNLRRLREGKGYPQTDTMFALMELYEVDLCDIIYEPQPEQVVLDYYFFDKGICIEILRENKNEQSKRFKMWNEIIRKGIAG